MSVGATASIVAVACARYRFDAGSTLAWVGFLTGIGLVQLLQLFGTRSPEKGITAAVVNKRVRSSNAPSGAPSPRTATVETSSVKATAAGNSQPEMRAEAGVEQSVTLLSGFAQKQNRVGLWQKRFLELPSDSVYLKYYLDATQSVGISQRNDSPNNRNHVDLRLCALVLAQGTILNLHMHDKRIFRFRFSDNKEAATWRRSLYQKVKALHAHKGLDPPPAAATAAHVKSEFTEAQSSPAQNHGDSTVEAENEGDGYWRFLAGCNGDEAAASKRFVRTKC